MSKNLVFTSCGDNTKFDILWTNNQNMKYDLYIIYYGDDTKIFEKYSANYNINIITSRKGSKFQNFKFFYDTYNDIIKKYDYFFILDDDIIFDVDDINKMFYTAKQFNLDICGPSFKPESKISHEITLNKPGVEITYTNFVEVNVPLFSYDALVTLMNVYDVSLIGWGIDYLYIIANGLNRTESYAIVHSVTCINPFQKDKQKKRYELSFITDYKIRSQIWNAFAKKNGYKNKFNHLKYKSIMAYEYNEVSVGNYL